MSHFFHSLRKIFSYILLWGPFITLYKILGRLRLSLPFTLPLPNRSVIVVGCGQFAFQLWPLDYLSFLFSPFKYSIDPSHHASLSFSKCLVVLLFFLSTRITLNLYTFCCLYLF